MQGILYVFHGSRIPEAIDANVSFFQLVKEQIEVPLQEMCFLELAEPDISQGIERLVNQGGANILIVPVLLLSAGHYYKDIPEKIIEVQEKYPEIVFRYGKPLGVQERILDVLIDRINESRVPVKEDTKLLLIGRGSKFEQTKIDIETICERLKGKTGLHHIQACFLAVTEPSFEQVLQQSLNEHHSQIFLVPYLWFTGFLMNFLQRKANEYSHCGKEIILCRELGDHPHMIAALKDRVYESLILNE
ncbi:sirohydrochlorin chelatase [Pallidibacillus thermolactis]|jgi:sirohydrochlorin ferrochelatase|uniref:sirohydrochlorin chelatase n=1 Tax=Pallidibacillus thermolactis TaxID=251051 RepID=UPI002E2117C4|nr:sirohydrochlorin chelatase [Pallidibacillus thermolactis subsp. kokeshiiformis]